MNLECACGKPPIGVPCRSLCQCLHEDKTKDPATSGWLTQVSLPGLGIETGRCCVEDLHSVAIPHQNRKERYIRHNVIFLVATAISKQYNLVKRSSGSEP